MRHDRFQTLLLVVTALSLGAGLYLVCRDPVAVYLLPDYPRKLIPEGTVQQLLCYSLPSLLHIYAFILSTALIIGPTRKALVGICLLWVILEGMFEIGQGPAFADGIAAVLPAWFNGIPLLEAAGDYFRHGTFDPLDLLFVAVGAIAAYGTLRRYAKKGDAT